MIIPTVNIRKHRRIGWMLWAAESFCLFATFVIGYGPAFLGCLFFAIWLGFRGDPLNNEY